MKEDVKIIPFDSPEAAKQVTVTLWRASDGRMYNEEHTARFAGCTHRPCEKCGQLTEVSYIHCGKCREIADEARWMARPRKPWDGEQMVYSEVTDKYYESPADALEMAGYDANETDPDGPISLEDLRLVLCNPEFASIDAGNFQDITPEDGDLPDAVIQAIKSFNADVSDSVCCWTPGKYALEAT